MTRPSTRPPWKVIYKMKDPDKIFDLVLAANYFAGTGNGKMPVEESRQAFERIRELLEDAD